MRDSGTKQGRSSAVALRSASLGRRLRVLGGVGGRRGTGHGGSRNTTQRITLTDETGCFNSVTLVMLVVTVVVLVVVYPANHTSTSLNSACAGGGDNGGSVSSPTHTHKLDPCW